MKRSLRTTVMPAALLLILNGCQDDPPAQPSPDTSASPASPSIPASPSVPVHEGEIHWSSSADGSHVSSTHLIIPGTSTGGTLTLEQTGEPTHNVEWEVTGHADGSDQYEFTIRIGDGSGSMSLNRSVEYDGAEVVVYEEEGHHIVIRPPDVHDAPDNN